MSKRNALEEELVAAKLEIARLKELWTRRELRDSVGTFSGTIADGVQFRFRVHFDTPQIELWDEGKERWYRSLWLLLGGEKGIFSFELDK